MSIDALKLGITIIPLITIPNNTRVIVPPMIDFKKKPVRNLLILDKLLVAV
jgi:hypothetical protein